jgi:pimeloyl-ACP methyl ester carboxylesterase
MTLEDGSPLTLRARVTIAILDAPTESPVPESLAGVVPIEGPPTLPDAGRIFLFVHGHSSRAEESDGLAAALLERHAALGRGLTVVSVDLPGTGYTERFEPADILAAADPARGQDVLLRFLETFLVALVDALDAAEPGVTDRIDAVIGGSLGGNLSLRLAERGDELPWVRRAVAWSPVSIDYSWTRAKLLGGGDEGFMDVIKHEAVRRTAHEADEAEDRGARARYFVDGVMSVRKQSNYWYRDGWACGDRLVAEGLRQLAEVYDSRLRRIHYRLAYEQLVFSHIEPAPGAGDLRFHSIVAPLLVIAGEEDNSVPMQTHYFVDRLAPYLESPGETLFFADTGHAMHAERPQLLAESITDFVERYDGPW